MSVEKVGEQIRAARADGAITASEARTITSRELETKDDDLLLPSSPVSVGRIVSEQELALVASLLTAIDRKELDAEPAARAVLERFVRAGADGPARKLAEGAVHGAAAGALVGGLAQIGPQGLLLGSLTGWWGPLGLLAGGALLGAATGMWAGWHGRID